MAQVFPLGNLNVPQGTTLYPSAAGFALAAGNILVSFDASGASPAATLTLLLERSDDGGATWRDDSGQGIVGGTFTDRHGVVTGVHNWSTSWIGGQARLKATASAAFPLTNVSVTLS